MAIEFIDEVRARSGRFSERLKHPLESEEAAKTAFVLPFIQMLGYDIFDPSEVVPEFTADAGTKRHEKVDYAIMRDGRPIILVECKRRGASLNGEQVSQLLRYFTVTTARIAILTDGIRYLFHSDLEEPNVMDARPFFEFNMLDFSEPHVRELTRFTRPTFDETEISDAARNLKYTNEIKRVLAEELASPSDDFLRFIVRRVHAPAARVSTAARRAIYELAHPAMGQFMHEYVNDRLKTALTANDHHEQPDVHVAEPEALADEPRAHSALELEALEVVRNVIGDLVAPERVALATPTKYYTSVVLQDDTNRDRTLCRLAGNRISTLSVAVNLDEANGRWKRHRLGAAERLHDHSDAIRARLASLLPAQPDDA